MLFIQYKKPWLKAIQCPFFNTEICCHEFSENKHRCLNVKCFLRSVVRMLVVIKVFNLIHNWWPIRCNFLVYFFVPNQHYMFRTMFSPIIRSTWLYLQLLINSTYVVGYIQHRWTMSEAVNTVKCPWWWAKASPETCRFDWVQINK